MYPRSSGSGPVDEGFEENIYNLQAKASIARAVEETAGELKQIDFDRSGAADQIGELVGKIEELETALLTRQPGEYEPKGLLYKKAAGIEYWKWDRLILPAAGALAIIILGGVLLLVGGLTGYTKEAIIGAAAVWTGGSLYGAAGNLLQKTVKVEPKATPET